MRANGKTTKLMDKELWFIQIKTNMKDNGVMGLNQEKEHTSLLMVLGTKVSGKMMKRMAKAYCIM